MSSLVIACSIVLVLCPQAARAVPVGGAVILDFGAGYPAGDGSAVHRGVDVACAEGDQVVSPSDGEISFVGRVPSASGGTMLAVTIVTAHGSLTLMPLSEAVVARGQRVDAGQRLGAVSASGDPSSPGTHLHVGLKKAGMYLDPSGLLVAPAQAGQPSTPDAMAPGDVVVPDGGHPAPGAAEAVIAVPSATPAGQAQGARSGAGATLPEGVTLADTTRAAQLSAQGGEAKPAADPGRTVGASVAAADVAAQGGLPVLPGVGLPAAYTPPASPVSRAVGALADALPVASTVSPRGVAALVASLLAGSALLARRSLRRRIIASSVSDRLGYLLQHLKAGDTLRGLTSCPGPLPSQSRGRIAQGR